MGNKQQTAVEWAFQQISNIDWKYLSDSDRNDLFDQAIQMEREQIVDSYSNGWHDGQDEIINRIAHIDKGGDESGLNHYNQTYADRTSS